MIPYVHVYVGTCWHRTIYQIFSTTKIKTIYKHMAFAQQWPIIGWDLIRIGNNDYEFI